MSRFEYIHPWQNGPRLESVSIWPESDVRHNLNKLVELLGEQWVKIALKNPGREHHPLQNKLTAPDVFNYIELCVLADDLKTVAHVDGVSDLIRDLRNAGLFAATAHTIHTAAWFARHDPARVKRFFPQSSTRVPDYLVHISGEEVAVEAKLMLQSEAESRFGDAMRGVASAIIDDIMKEDRSYPLLTLVIKDADNLPSQQSVISCARAMLKASELGYTTWRESEVNAFIISPDQYRPPSRTLKNPLPTRV